MNREEFRKKLKKQKNWTPGWDAVEGVFSALYPDQAPVHFATEPSTRISLGGDQYLDGFSIYDSPNGYKHIVTFGMTELYADEEALAGKRNKWGYEMTIKLPETDNEKCMWAIQLLSDLARYTYTENRPIAPFQYISGNGSSICPGRNSKITALMTVPDTEAGSADTIYGETEFLQLVGITEQELTWLQKGSANVRHLYDRMVQKDPFLVTNLNRTESFVCKGLADSKGCADSMKVPEK